eukprot:5565211-Amphidinium_carterae.1
MAPSTTRNGQMDGKRIYIRGSFDLKIPLWKQKTKPPMQLLADAQVPACALRQHCKDSHPVLPRT